MRTEQGRRWREPEQRLGARLAAPREPEDDDGITTMLDDLDRYGVVARHHVRLRGSRSRIDHLLVAPSGVYVIDTETWPRRLELRTRGSPLRSRERLYAGTRDRTGRADALAKKLARVRRSLGAHAVPVQAVLCVLRSDWPLFATPIDINCVTVMWPKELERRATQLGKLDADSIAAIAVQLDSSLP